jgi:hypothetical protein
LSCISDSALIAKLENLSQSLFEAPVKGATREKLFIVLIMHYDSFKGTLNGLAESLELRARRFLVLPTELVVASQALKARFRLLNLDSTSSTDADSLPQTITQELEMMRLSWQRSEQSVDVMKSEISTLTASFGDLERRLEESLSRREDRLIDWLSQQFESIRRPCFEMATVLWETMFGQEPTIQTLTPLNVPVWGGTANGGTVVASRSPRIVAGERVVSTEDAAKYPEYKITTSKVTIQLAIRDIMILKLHTLEMPLEWDKAKRKTANGTRTVYRRLVDLLVSRDVKYKRWIEECLPPSGVNDALQRRRADYMTGI